jgi:hypothetical protein
LAGISTKSAGVGIAVAIGASVAAWYAIRGFEKLLDRGVDAGFTAVRNQMNRPQPPSPYRPPPQYGQQPPPRHNGYSPPAAVQPQGGHYDPQTRPGR